MTQGYTPPNFVLAQETHFFAGLAFGLSGRALGSPWWYGSALILVVDMAKELTFDRNWPAPLWKLLLPKSGGERQPFLPRPPAGYRDSGLVDWLFYLAGVAAATALLLVRLGFGI